MSRRVLGVVVAFTLAAVGTLLLVSYVNGAEERALAGERVVKVLVVSEPVEAGTPAEALTGEVQLEQVPAKVKAKGAVTTLSSLDGLVASAALVPGEQVIRGRFVSAKAAATQAGEPGAGSAAADTSARQQLSVALEPERVLGGTIREGDTVAIYASTASPLPDVTHLILHDVVVARVQGGQPTTGDDEKATDEAASRADKIVVTLALEPAAAESVVWTMEHGTIWLSLDPKGGDPAGTRLVTPEIVFG